MEKEEIEIWYEEQKQHLSDEYIKCIQRGMGIDERQVRFERLMQNLNDRYFHKLVRLDVDKKRRERNRRVGSEVTLPVRETGIALAYSGGCIGEGIAGVCQAVYGALHFRMQLFWIRNSYKLPDRAFMVFRPFHLFYMRTLWRPVTIAVKPFKAVGRGFARAGTATGHGFLFAVRSVWKGVKITAKKSAAAYKAVSSKAEAISKRYHAWYAKRLQESLEKKQAKKEEMQKRAEEKAKLKQDKNAAEDSADGADGADGAEGTQDAAKNSRGQQQGVAGVDF